MITFTEKDLRSQLTTEEQAEMWFSIMPKEGQWQNTLSYDRKKRRVILNGIERN